MTTRKSRFTTSNTKVTVIPDENPGKSPTKAGKGIPMKKTGKGAMR